MSFAQVHTVSVTKSNGGELEFKAVLTEFEADKVREMLEIQLGGGAIADFGVFPADSQEYLSYEDAIKEISRRAMR